MGRRSVKIRIERDRAYGNYGVIFQAGSKEAFEIRIEPALRTVGIYPVHSNLYFCLTKRVLQSVGGLEEGCLLEVNLKNDVLDMGINQDRTLICRLDRDYADGESLSWYGFVKDGKAVFEVRGDIALRRTASAEELLPLAHYGSDSV